MGGDDRRCQRPTQRRNGLPPRGRGRRLHGVLLVGNLRITPAWAGTTSERSPLPILHSDYPRVGGDDSDYDSAQTRAPLDYPRVGGDDRRCQRPTQRRNGLPPRGRGRRLPFRASDLTRRITPAWAGTTAHPRCSAPRVPDYPRVGGDDGLPERRHVAVDGLPPRGRGRRSSTACSVVLVRITPAWAGTTLIDIQARSFFTDYPRVGGDDQRCRAVGSLRYGLPPRGRGRPPHDFPLLAVERITPAWAGTTLHLQAFYRRLRAISISPS